MADHIKIKPANGTWVVRSGGAVIGESKNAMELTEGAFPPVIYFPRADLAMALLDKTETTSKCPWKGSATYYTIMAKSGPIPDAAWSYETPMPGLEAIAGHIAFYPSKTTIEEI